MDYTDKEREILNIIERTDFKNLSKNDFLSYASKLNELRPEVAAQVIAQYPEFLRLINSALSEYKSILGSVIISDDSSVKQVYELHEREIDTASSSRTEYISLAKSVLADCSKCLDDSNMPPEQQQEILDREVEILHAVDKKDTEIREQERETVTAADEKDSEKRKFNWSLIGTASAVVLAAVGIGAAVLGGKFDIKLPIKK